MAVTSAQLTSRMRTWALVAALTALMITFGALLGNTFLWLFAALAVLANVGGYFYSDRIALRLSRAQPLLEARTSTCTDEPERAPRSAMGV